jgi:hypothetical protein
MNRYEIALGKLPDPNELTESEKWFKAIWGKAHPDPQDIFCYTPYIPLVVSRIVFQDVPEGIYRTFS